MLYRNNFSVFKDDLFQNFPRDCETLIYKDFPHVASHTIHYNSFLESPYKRYQIYSGFEYTFFEDLNYTSKCVALRS